MKGLLRAARQHGSRRSWLEPWEKPTPPKPVTYAQPHHHPTEAEAKLDRCPFCGSHAEYVKVRGDYGYTSDGLTVRCKDNRCASFYETTEKWEQDVGYTDVTAEVKERLTERWNRRHGSKNSNL